MNEAVVLYVPVLHEGYIRFLKKHSHGAVYVLGNSFLSQHRDIVKDIRAISPEEIAVALRALFPDRQVSILEIENESQINSLDSNRWVLHMPGELLTRDIAAEFFTKAIIEFDTIFLRWDSESSTAQTPVDFDKVIDVSTFTREWMNEAYWHAAKSADWWRQVGAIVMTPSDEVLSATNQHVPYEFMPYINGDPRSSFNKGINIELSTVLHAETRLIAEAARLGLCLDGAELFTTTFPCPWCAKIVAYSGIRRVYFVEGYTMLDAESILKSQGIDIVKVTI